MVLFTSERSLKRAENIRAVYDAYDGPKEFIQVDPYNPSPELTASRFELRVTDELVRSTPGKVIMIGHGLSGGKYYGLDQPHPYFRRCCSQLLTYVVATSEAMIDMTAKQCGVDVSRVLPLGMPRTDAYFGKRKGDGGTLLAKKRAYLYAPTFRNGNEPPMPRIDWDKIDNALTDDELLVVKPHMITKHILEGHYDHIIEVSSDVPSTPYLIDCDVLITDYSSIMLDAHILRKPVILFEKEKGFVEARGMYLDYPGGYASRYATTEDDLIAMMQVAEGQGQEDLKCLELTAGSCDGHSTERVIELIKETL